MKFRDFIIGLPRLKIFSINQKIEKSPLSCQRHVCPPSAAWRHLVVCRSLPPVLMCSSLISFLGGATRAIWSACRATDFAGTDARSAIETRATTSTHFTFLKFLKTFSFIQNFQKLKTKCLKKNV